MMDSREGTLYLCPTPIGNLEDITLRALRILKEVDIIAAEDTRVTAKLLNHYEIKARQMSYHEHNEKTRGQELIELLKEGKDVAVVTDAGTPGISDPGAHLVKLAIEKGIPVVPLPGASAVICALVASGLSTERFAFEGFLPRRSRERRELLAKLAREERTIVLYESPHRIQRTLKDLYQCLGDRPMVLAREITKLHESFHRGTIGEILEVAESQALRGEMVLVIGGASPDASATSDPEEVKSKFKAKMNEMLAEGMGKKQALKAAAEELGISRNEAYKLMIDN
jgi:16S rRNA (cytidine1402-2'-O)-methyltransferase